MLKHLVFLCWFKELRKKSNTEQNIPVIIQSTTPNNSNKTIFSEDGTIFTVFALVIFTDGQKRKRAHARTYAHTHTHTHKFITWLGEMQMKQLPMNQPQNCSKTHANRCISSSTPPHPTHPPQHPLRKIAWTQDLPLMDKLQRGLAALNRTVFLSNSGRGQSRRRRPQSCNETFVNQPRGCSKTFVIEPRGCSKTFAIQPRGCMTRLSSNHEDAVRRLSSNHEDAVRRLSSNHEDAWDVCHRTTRMHGTFASGNHQSVLQVRLGWFWHRSNNLSTKCDSIYLRWCLCTYLFVLHRRSGPRSRSCWLRHL